MSIKGECLSRMQACSGGAMQIMSGRTGKKVANGAVICMKRVPVVYSMEVERSERTEQKACIACKVERMKTDEGRNGVRF